MMSTVYAVQEQHRFDSDKRKLVPRFSSVKAAEKFGRLQYLLSPSAAPWAVDSVLHDLNERLTTFSDDDYLLLIGNPILIGLAVSTAARWNNGFVKMLQWSGKDKQYIPVEAQVFPRVSPLASTVTSSPGEYRDDRDDC
jgi:hypothetical protein